MRVLFCSHVTLLTRGCLALIRYTFFGKGLTGIALFLKVPTVMRPCDGTSGLVRGNRRKAVFAFKGLFSEGCLTRFSLSGARLTTLYGSAGKNRKPPSATRFLSTKPQVGALSLSAVVGMPEFCRTLPDGRK